METPKESLHLETPDVREEKDLAVVREGVKAYTEQYVAVSGYVDLTVFARDATGTVTGAILGETGRGGSK